MIHVAFSRNIPTRRDMVNATRYDRATLQWSGWYPTWSPDGARIAYVSSETTDTEIWVMAADGSDPTNLTRNPTIDTAPRWVRRWGGFCGGEGSEVYRWAGLSR